jgi:murein DD-endopeptidase MepM/ murein hydrolase activator NlpD
MEPPRGSCSHFHDGIDIANGTGTPVRAPADGVVAFVGWNPYDSSDPSFMLVMGHAGGLESRFMHLDPRYVVRAGQSVKKGQLIAYMGNTGNSTGAHLHWEIYRGNTPVNPRSLV